MIAGFISENRRQNMKATKKQRKLNTEPNERVKNSLEKGHLFNKIYLGRNPVYKIKKPAYLGEPVKYVKTAKGIPFVNVTLRKPL